VSHPEAEFLFANGFKFFDFPSVVRVRKHYFTFVIYPTS